MTGLEIGVPTWLLLVTLGGIAGMDAVSWPQAMFSRPIVSATLAGAFLGGTEAGFLAGAVLELYALRHPPFGAARYPDAGPAGVVAGAAFASAVGQGTAGRAGAGSDLPALVTALAAGWAVGWLGSRSVRLLRRVNERLLDPRQELASEPERLERRHRLAIVLDALRGALLAAAFVIPAAILARVTIGGPLPEGAVTLSAVALTLGVALAAGAGARTLSSGTRGWPVLLAGGAAALLVAVT